MAKHHRLRRSLIGVRAGTEQAKQPETAVLATGAKLLRYVDSGVPSRAPEGATAGDALAFSDSGPNRMSLLLYAQPSPTTIEEVATAWQLHPILVEDLLKGYQRQKLERYNDVLFLVARSAWYLDADESVQFAEFHVLLRANAVIVLCQDWRWIDGTDVTAFDRDESPSSGEHVNTLLADQDMLRLGPSAIAYQLLDAIVDGYIPVLEGLAVDKDQIERQVFGGDAAATERIYRLSQEVIDLKQACSSLKAVVSALKSGSRKFGIAEELDTYLADLADHLSRVDAEVTEMRESLNQILTVNSTLVAQRQNEDMKKISGWAAILFAPTLVAAIYGMNFESMPELHWPLGYPLAILMMVGFATVLYGAFKRRKWM